jgi:recombination protein RecT
MAEQNTAMVNAPNNKPAFSTFMTSNAVQKRIGAMIGGDGGPRFISAVVSAVSVNPALSQCDYGTILSAALLGESLKLSPSPQLGQYYMVPFKDKKRGTTVAQFQLGYKGYIQMAIRSGQYKKLNVLAIKQGELIRYDPLNEEIEVRLIEDENQRELTATVGYYAMFELVNGYRKTMYWSREKMIAHADRYSMAFNAAKYQDLMDGKIPQADMWKYSSFWYKDFDGMAYKTMLRQLISKWGVMSIDLQTALSKDMAVTYGDGSVEYVDNSADFTSGIADDTYIVESQNDAGADFSADGKRQVSMNDL